MLASMKAPERGGADDARADLEELREQLRSAMREADTSVKAQIAGQLRAVIKDLAALGPATSRKSPADEIAARREARIAGTRDTAPASRRSQPRRRGGSNRTG